MGRIDELHSDHPTWGYRTITKIIRRDHGICVNRMKIRRMMRDMGVYTIYPKPNLSKRYHSQFIRPYLLRKLNIERPNQVWGVDITYIRMHRGFMYLFEHGPVAGQCTNRAVFPDAEIRSDLHPRVRNAQRASESDQPLHSRIQHVPASFLNRKSDSERGLLWQNPQRRITRKEINLEIDFSCLD